MRSRALRRWAWIWCLGVLSVCGTARATLTDSEKAQVAGFIEEGVASKASRARALVARPDLTPAEVAEPLVAGYTRSPFDERRLRFSEALLFGPGSAPARNTLAPALVQALLARASNRLSIVPAEPQASWSSRVSEAADEVMAIYRFIDQRIANAGRPPPDGHDAGAGIRDDALRAAAEAMQRHLGDHAAWWDGKDHPSARRRRLYLQGALALVDLGRGVVERFTLAEWLGLDGAARAAFERHGVLWETDGDVADRSRAAFSLFERAPSDSISLFWLSKTPTFGLSARRELVSVGTRLDSEPPRLAPERLWPDDVIGSEPDAQLAQVALAVARSAARRALAANARLREVATAALSRAEAAGVDGYLAWDLVSRTVEPRPTAHAGLRGLTAELLLSHATRLVLLDASRALDLAIIRAARGRIEPLEQLALALSVVGNDRAAFEVGVVSDSGAIAAQAVSAAEYDAGIVNAFSFGGRRYAIVRGGAGAESITIDGKRPVSHELPSFRLRFTEGESWTAPGGMEMERLFGEPAAASVDDGRFVLKGSRGGFDAVAIAASDSTERLSARVVPRRAGGGLLLGGAAGKTSYTGVALIISAEPRRAQLVAVDGMAKAWQLAPPLELGEPPAAGYAVTLSLSEDAILGEVDGRRLEGKLPSFPVRGRAGLVAGSDGEIEVRGAVLGAKGKK